MSKKEVVPAIVYPAFFHYFKNVFPNLEVLQDPSEGEIELWFALGWCPKAV